MDTDSADSAPTSHILVGIRMWNMLQEVVASGHELKSAHEHALKSRPKANLPKNVARNDEMKIIKATKDFHWFGLSNVLAQVVPAPPFISTNNLIEVENRHLTSRVNALDGLRVMVDTMLKLAENQDLVKSAPVQIEKTTGMVIDDGSLSYRGPILRKAVMRAFNALTECDGYAAEQEASELFNRMCNREYKPQPQNPLASSPFAVRSQPTQDPGL